MADAAAVCSALAAARPSRAARFPHRCIGRRLSDRSLRESICHYAGRLKGRFARLRTSSWRCDTPMIALRAIACAAILDDALRVLISARLIKLGKDWDERIFGDPSAPLG